MSLWNRLLKLERLLRPATDPGPFAGSPRWWAALYGPWPDADLTDAELAELRPLFAPAADSADPVEAIIREVESLTPTTP